MKHRNVRISTPALVFIIILGTILYPIFYSLSALYVYHAPWPFPSDHPDTRWKCEKLGIELVVNGKGKLSGTYNNGSELIPLDVTTRIPTSSPHIRCYVGDELLHLHCFFENIENGVFYVTIGSAETTLDIDAVPDEVPYTFVKQVG